jgi:hypothetical protein
MKSLVVVVALLTGCAARMPITGGGDDSGSGKGDGDGSGSDAGTSGAYIIDETFNEVATGFAPGSPWVVAESPTGSVTAAEVPFPADKSIAIVKPDASGTSSLATSFAPQSGRVVFEAKVKAAETAGFKAIPYIYDATGAAVASISFQDGNLNAHIGATTTLIQTFAANVWYRVRVVVDTTQGTFDLYVDGVRKEHAVALRAASPSVAKVSYFMDGVNTGTLYVDNVKVYTEAAYIGAPPSPVFDARDYGAKGDGVTNDTAAIQAAADAAAGTGGSVVLSGGTFLSGTVTLGSKLTLFVDSSAVLLGSTNVADYPTQTPATGNTQLSNTQRALIYVPNATNVTIDGGGVIDGQGDSFDSTKPEATRPLLIWSVLSQQLTVQNLYLRKGAVWSLVSMESDHVVISNINLQSDNITHDGIDIVDGTDITVEASAINAGDDAMCLKSGVRRGIDTMLVKDSVFTGNNGGSNGIKVGTATYGAFTNVTIQDAWVKDVQYAAMAVESRQGADIEAMSFKRIEFSNTGAAFFVYLAQQSTTHPIGDVPKLGSIDSVSFTDIAGSTASWPNSPHQGSLITGNIFNSVTYPITNLAFANVAVAFDGGLASIPASPPEAMPNQYPEANMFGDLPAWAYYVRHVAGVSFTACTSSVAATDARQLFVTDDVTGLVGSP